MEKQYFYRRHIRKMYKAVPIILGILATVFILAIAVLFQCDLKG